ncbi:hypothetical protein BOSP111201_14155 [Bordetella sputigena]|uniref:DUF6776 family protein n=1 Tax=Bordetella sputigena TaxID=1416810 RepID=UPI0039EFCAB6
MARSRLGMVAGVLAILVVVGGLAAGVTLLWPAVSDRAAAQAQIAALRAQLAAEQAQVQALGGQLAASDADLAVERAARRALEDSLAALQVQAGQLRDRLAFYDQLLPAGPAGTLSIRAVEITRIPAGLRYRVLLMRSARPGLAPFVGSLRFVALGTRDGAEVRLPLAPLQSEPGADAGTLVPLEVDQYRSSEGILALPPDFTPAEVAVEVVRDGIVQASQQAAVAF